MWVKSARCESSHCVEGADLGPVKAVRNSTEPDTQLTFAAGDWATFIAGVRLGEFDR
ncbi:MAG TPA: DUF397 domain-containing protein [Asanoa sp.]